MPYLVDGHNLIPKIPGMSLKMIDDENHLIELLQDFCRQQQKDVEVFFDRAPAGSHPKRKLVRLTVNYVREGCTADDAIYKRLRKLGGEARNWKVVSSDRAVQAFARQEHAQAIDSEVFARQLLQVLRTSSAGTDRLDHESSPEDINEWLKTFQQKPKRQP
jgi:uncharacterized protein